MQDEALRIEDLHLTYRGLSGTAFSKPGAFGFFNTAKNDGDNELISGANLSLKRGETLCIGGPSGQGKSALLRVIAGLARPSSGRVFYFGEYIPPERLTALEVAKRQVGLVFQNGALISNLRVRDNIALPLRYHKKGTAAEIEEKINMAMDPMLLLMDEPTAGLDNYNRRNLLPLIDNMRTLFKTSIIIITHDLMMAKELGCNLSFLYRKTLSEPHSFDYWLHANNDISKVLFRDLRTSG